MRTEIRKCVIIGLYVALALQARLQDVRSGCIGVLRNTSTG